jgi:hypothetical protein
MRPLQALCGAVLMAAFVSYGLSVGAQGPDQAASLRAAAEALASAAPHGDPAKPLTQIVGMLSQAAERALLPAEQRERLLAAHAGLQKDGWSAEPAARSALNEVYAARNGGRRFRFPAGVATIEQARHAYQRELDRAVAALEKDRPAEAVTPMLELLLLVSTPMAAN